MKICKQILKFSLLGIFLYSGQIQAQQNVFSRDNSGTGDFGSSNLPWFYQTSNNNQGDPDNGNSTRNFVKIGHNNNTTMVTNGRFYQVNTLDFEASATSPRIINNSGGGLSVSGGIYNASSAIHTFNTPIGIDGGTVQLHANSMGGLVFNSTIFINNNTVEFGNLGTGNITVSGVMEGTGNLTKVGSNTLFVTGASTYSGTTTISAGTLSVGNGGTVGSLGTGNVINNAGLIFNRSNNATIANLISGTGTLTKLGAGTLTLTYDNTYSGTTTISAGAVSLGDGNGVGSLGSGNIVNNASLIVNRFINLSMSNIISGSGTLTKTGIAALDLTGANTYTGVTTINQGILRLLRTGGNTLPSTNSVTINGGVLRVSSNQTLAGLTLTSGELRIDSGVTLTLNNLTIPNGFTITNNGTLIINGVLIDNRATKTFEGSVRYAGVSGNQTILSATYNNLEFAGNATKVFEGALTIQGNVAILGGSLTLGSQNLNRSTVGGSFSMAANTSLTIGTSLTFPANYSVYSLDASSTTHYNGAEQTIANLNGNAYGNLILSNTGIKNLAADIVVGANMTLQDDVQVSVGAGNSITIHGSLNRLNDSEFTVESDGNLIQTGASNNNVGSIVVNRNALIKRLDMTLWSSPVADQNLLAFSPQTLPNRFFTYDETENGWVIVPNVASHTMSAGQGYAVRAPNNWSLTPAIFGGKTEGVPNSGNITQSFSSNHPTARFNLVGNPYPSALNLRAFYNANDTKIENKFYLYEHTLGSPTPAGQTNYGVLTLGDVPVNNVYIPASNSYNIGNEAVFQDSESVMVSQGFFIKALEGQSGTVLFNNTMRSKTQGIFFRNSNLNETQSSTFRLEMSSPDGFFNQAVVGFYDFASDELDMMDTKGVGAPLYTLANNEKYVVQGRSLPLNQTAVIPLGFRAGVEGIFKISVVDNQGIFENEQHILLHDMLLGVYHNIQQSAYQFNASVGTHDERFQIVFVAVLSNNNPVLENNPWSVFVQNETLQLVSLNDEILQRVQVYDISGRLLYENAHVNQNRYSFDDLKPVQAILIIKGTTETGKVFTQKVKF